MTHGALVGLIHHQCLQLQSGPYHDNSAVTLMTTDVDSLESMGEMFHESWAQLLEVIIGTYLLTRQIGWFGPVPIFIIFCQ